MAAAAAPDPTPEILPWLKSLPVAPEYHPTLAEFQDPISYILKIEPEASKFGICKIVPPLPPPPKKTAISNLNRSFAARHPCSHPTFNTRQQQIGFCPRKPRPVQKPVWQSGETYTLQQFEAKARQFERVHLKRGGKRAPSALEIESLFWKACADKPFSVEYANDMPGSAFAAASGKKCGETVGETAWNMRGASRAKGSLLRFMKEEIPGVTSPMVYVAMMFSWFAWHVEDHDLHSLNYLHMGAGKTWYGVPRDAAVAFEEIVRVHGYGGEVNPIVTFAILGEKTTVMSPEVLIGAGIPCCRLVQNAGEFVVTFPRAYHSGFSHGFNCGEAANIATPEWLRVAKEAAIRRASINYPPMVSHFQLLYALALSLCSRIPMSISSEPRSSRLKDKKRSEGEIMVKELFVKNVIQNNELLHILLEKGSSCIILPQNSSDVSLSSNARVGSQIKVKPRLSLGLCSPEEAMEASKNLFSEDIMLDMNTEPGHLNGFGSMKGKSVTLCQGRRIPSVKYSQYGTDDLYSSTSDLQNMDSEKEGTCQGDGLLGQALFACVTCGILSFACVAVVQPREAAARYLMSADCSIFSDQIIDTGVTTDLHDIANGITNNSNLNTCSGRMEKDDKGVLYDILVQSADYQVQLVDQRAEPASDTKVKAVSSLDLLAFAYGDSSDSEEEAVRSEISAFADENNLTDISLASNHDVQLQSSHTILSSKYSSLSKVQTEDTELFECSLQDNMGNPISVEPHRLAGTNRNLKTPVSLLPSIGVSNSPEVGGKELDSSCVTCIGTSKVHHCDFKMDDPDFDSADFSMHCGPARSISNRAATGKFVETAQFGNIDTAKNPHIPFTQRSDKDSSRMHIFCLEHATEVEKQLRQIGGVHMMLLCHPDYPKVEAQAKSLADELGINHLWKDISFREPNEVDKENIRLALEDEEAIPGNGDWAVKLGINLYYSASLCKSPLYSKQMPYNSVLYKAFGRSTPDNSPTKPKVFERRLSRQKKIVVAGKWCGKVWMSNQVHPYLAQRETEKEEHVKEFCNQGVDWKLEACSDTGIKELCNQGVDQKHESDSDSGEAEQETVCGRNLLPCKVTAAITRKSGKRRGRPFERVDTKKPKCLFQLEDDVEIAEDLPENPSLQCERILRSGRMKCGSPPLHNGRERNSGQGSLNLKDETEGGPSTRLRTRPPKPKEGRVKVNMEVVRVKPVGERPIGKKAKKTTGNADLVVKDDEAEYQCDVEGCLMGFSTKQDLALHKRNICPVKGCGKKFFSHKYLVQHRRVHMDDRPLKCPWKGCRMTFKWAWARTEHIRVHTGARPYMCREAGCGQTFRFVSDFSRHKRKTGHSVKKKGRG
ncbi:lysine-specific demethylase REF6 [Magnolia sinica]|uniref:lysine-specific demethylase REF6 n=1 Tax=Magnolia sinica TaxID=86752 RepID=UPI00265A6145|nr:lysine-specific demethylase REF6 [Magnolia sinica]